MGLDAVEMVLEVEEDFEIKIEDHDAQKIVTVGQLHECIVSKLPANSRWEVTRAGVWEAPGPCLTAVAFYALRQTFANLVNVPPKSIRPRSGMEDLLPRSNRRRMWKLAREHLQLQLPKLDHSKRARALIVALAGGGAAMLAFLTFGALELPGAAIAALIGFGLLYMAFDRMLVPFAVDIPHHRTFADLARWVLATNHEAIQTRARSKQRQSVWSRLVVIISEQLGVDPAMVTPQASFVKDLGAD
jgi:acyl carrier protein